MGEEEMAAGIPIKAVVITTCRCSSQPPTECSVSTSVSRRPVARWRITLPSPPARRRQGRAGRSGTRCTSPSGPWPSLSSVCSSCSCLSSSWCISDLPPPPPPPAHFTWKRTACPQPSDSKDVKLKRMEGNWNGFPIDFLFLQKKTFKLSFFLKKKKRKSKWIPDNQLRIGLPMHWSGYAQ